MLKFTSKSLEFSKTGTYRLKPGESYDWLLINWSLVSWVTNNIQKQVRFSVFIYKPQFLFF